MLTVKQLAERWSVSEGLIYKLVSSGNLKAHRFGRAIRFSDDQIDGFLNSSPQKKLKQTVGHLRD